MLFGSLFGFLRLASANLNYYLSDVVKRFKRRYSATQRQGTDKRQNDRNGNRSGDRIREQNDRRTIEHRKKHTQKTDGSANRSEDKQQRRTRATTQRKDIECSEMALNGSNFAFTAFNGYLYIEHRKAVRMAKNGFKMEIRI